MKIVRSLDLSKLLFYVSCSVALFVWGMAVEGYKIFPYRILNFVFDSAEQVYADLDVIRGKHPRALLRSSRYEGDGVTKFDKTRAAPGLTLVSGFFDNGTEMRLLRLDGTVVNKWPVSFSEIWPDTDHIRPSRDVPQRDWNTEVHGVVLLPDGSVIFNLLYVGLSKMDRCGNIVWKQPSMAHHSVEASEDGNFWVGGRHYEDEVSAYPALKTPYLEDRILKVSQDGDVIMDISVPGLFLKNKLYPLLLANGVTWTAIPELEMVHLNDIEELPADIADRFPQFSAGDLLLSMRTHNLLMVIDPSTEVVKWHQTGPWFRQHDPDFQPNGTITLFNNNSDDTEQGSILGGSNIMAIEPTTRETKILYGDQGGHGFYTEFRGNHQLLDNGNILVAEAEAGRVFEVTKSGDLVWEFILRYDEENVSAMNTGQRYPEDYFTVEDWSCP